MDNTPLPAERPADYAIWTIQLARWRLAKQRGIPLLDITAKTGMSAFAPDFANVMAYKRGEMSEAEYTVQYKHRMRQSLSTEPEKWEQLKEHKEVALACYCASGQFCHRHLFADMMARYLEKEGFKVVQMGEVLPV